MSTNYHPLKRSIMYAQINRVMPYKYKKGMSK